MTIKKIAAVVGTSLFFGLGFSPIVYAALPVPKHYAQIGVVVTADYNNNLWSVMTQDGVLQYFSDGEDIEEGDVLKLIFSDNNTPEVEDDTIIDKWVFATGGNWRGLIMER